jgi:transcriptional regulator GlxA family with amidase domain
VPERHVRDGKVITAAGVSAGIDMALYLAARLADGTTARAAQLAIEYDPQPPFDSGNAAQTSPELRQLALRLLEDSQG